MRHGNHSETGDTCDFADLLEDRADQELLLQLLHRHRGEQQDQMKDVVRGVHTHLIEAQHDWSGL
jgi:hypothetical protein